VDYLSPLVVAFTSALIIAFLITPFLGRLARKYGFQDRPNPRRVELKPRLGGLGMYLAFIIALGLSAIFISSRTDEEWFKLIGLFLGASIVVVMGVVDDRRELPPVVQLAAQVLAAVATISFGVQTVQITNPFGTPLSNSMFDLSGPLAIGFTLFWLLGAMNTINFIDGIDGLAAGITTIAALVLFAHSFELGQNSVAVLPLALAGATLGFLPHNFPPARITMGTSGAVFLGYAVGALSVLGGTKAATVLLVLGLPIIDTAWIIVRRVMRGQSPFRGDRTHLHHRLMQTGMAPWQVLILFYTVCAIFGALALLLSSRVLKLYALGGMVLLVSGFLALLAQKGLQEEG
jgi:UDP-GlcNAc:undecaprenyl-phosphate GlcNAc-1-phosphate transferase